MKKKREIYERESMDSDEFDFSCFHFPCFPLLFPVFCSRFLVGETDTLY